MRFPRLRVTTILSIASLLALLGLALMLWGVLQPTALPVIIAMSVGQGFGMLSFFIYLLVVVADLRRNRIFARKKPTP